MLMTTWEQAMDDAIRRASRAEQTYDNAAHARITAEAEAWVHIANAITYRDHLNRPQPDPAPILTFAPDKPGEPSVD